VVFWSFYIILPITSPIDTCKVLFILHIFTSSFFPPPSSIFIFLQSSKLSTSFVHIHLLSSCLEVSSFLGWMVFSVDNLIFFGWNLFISSTCFKASTFLDFVWLKASTLGLLLLWSSLYIFILNLQGFLYFLGLELVLSFYHSIFLTFLDFFWYNVIAINVSWFFFVESFKLIFVVALFFFVYCYFEVSTFLDFFCFMLKLQPLMIFFVQSLFFYQLYQVSHVYIFLLYMARKLDIVTSRLDITNINNKIKKYNENPHLLYLTSQKREKF